MESGHTEQRAGLAARVRHELAKFRDAWVHGGFRKRSAILLFVASLLGVAVVSQVSVSRYLKYRKLARERAARMSKEKAPCVDMACAFSALEEEAKKNAALAEIKAATVNLGEFEIGLVGLGEGTRGRGGMKLEAEVAVEFDKGDTGRWVQENSGPARNEILASVATLSGVTREDLLTAEGKAKIRDRIGERLDAWLPSGKVKGVYFNKFLLQ